MELSNTQAELNKYGSEQEQGLPVKTSDSRNITISEWNTLLTKLGIVLADVRRLYHTLYSELPIDLNAAETALSSSIASLDTNVTAVDTKVDNYISSNDTNIEAILSDIQAIEYKITLGTYADGEETKEYATVKDYVEAAVADAAKFFEDYDNLDEALNTLKEIQKHLDGDGFTVAGITTTSDNRTITAKNHTTDTFEAFRTSVTPVSKPSGGFYNTIIATDSSGYMRTEIISDSMINARYKAGATKYDKYLVNLRTLDKVLDNHKLKPYTERLDDLTTRVETLELSHVQYNSVDFESVSKLPGNMKPDAAPILFLNRLGGKLSTKYSPYTNNIFKIVDVSSTECTVSSSGSLVFEDHGQHEAVIKVILPTPYYEYRLYWFGDDTAAYSFGNDPFAGEYTITPQEEDQIVDISFAEFYGLDAKFAIYRNDYSTEVFEPCTTFVQNIPKRALTYNKEGTGTIADIDFPKGFSNLADSDFGMDVGSHKSYIDLDEKRYYRVAYSGVLNDSADELWYDATPKDAEFKIFRWYNNQSVAHIECNYYRVKPVKPTYTDGESGEKIPLLEHAIKERTNCILYEPDNYEESFYVVTNEFESLASFKAFLKRMEDGSTPVEFVRYLSRAHYSDISDMLDPVLGDWNQYKDIFPMKCAQEGTLALSSKVDSINTDNVWGTYTYLTTKEL